MMRKDRLGVPRNQTLGSLKKGVGRNPGKGCVRKLSGLGWSLQAGVEGA